jgi:hypothetical protein
MVLLVRGGVCGVSVVLEGASAAEIVKTARRDVDVLVIPLRSANSFVVIPYFRAILNNACRVAPYARTGCILRPSQAVELKMKAKMMKA